MSKSTNILSGELNVFNNLCDKAKEVVFATYCMCKIEGRKVLKNELILKEELVNLTPIEQILAISTIYYDKMSVDEPKIKLNIKYQEHIKIDKSEYIADFAIYSVKTKNKTQKLKKPLIIECDGFEYHSKKEQMTHDYKRERTLKLNGFDILRFTGSQIYNEPIASAKEIFKYVSNILGG